MSSLNQREFEQVIKEAAQMLAEQFRIKREALWGAMHLRNLPPEVRLVHYRLQDPDMKLVLERVFPERYRENQQDFYALENKWEHGELDELKIDEAMNAALAV